MIKKSIKKSENIRQIDDTDRKILNMLSANSRRKLTDMARDTGLSITSIKARIDRLVEDEIITRFTIQVDTEKSGHPLGVHVRIKLKNITEKRMEDFTENLRRNRRVIDIFSILGFLEILGQKEQRYGVILKILFRNIIKKQI